MTRRLVSLGVLFSLELAAITVSLDNTHLLGYSGLAGFCGRWGPLLLRGTVVFYALFLTFAFVRSSHLKPGPINWRLACGHALALTVFTALSHVLYSGTASHPDLVAIPWLLAGVCAMGLGATALIQPRVWVELSGGAGYFAVAAALTALGGNAMRELWPRATALTFAIVQILLKPFGTFTADASTMTIGSQRFSGQISEQCSGLEGIGLILCFTTVWLVLFRKECRFPQALGLLPAGMAIIFFMNSVRIAALLLVGNAGFAAIAEGGFHSQAGWIVFNLVALGICRAAGHVSWISVRRPEVRPVNPTAAWVVPFVAILAAGMVSHALSGGFEWLYPLRFVAAAIALWRFRGVYRILDWRIDWMGVAGGLLVGAMWLALDRSVPTVRVVPIWWIVVRTLAAIVTVPLAEELAFRGFLYRRFLSPEFELASFRQFSWVALLGSSVLFGLLHGSRWFVGLIAGTIFALVMVRRGRIGNAMIAHAIANAMLAVAVLLFHRWDLW